MQRLHYLVTIEIVLLYIPPKPLYNKCTNTIQNMFDKFPNIVTYLLLTILILI